MYFLLLLSACGTDPGASETGPLAEPVLTLPEEDWQVDGCHWAYLEGVHPSGAHVEDTAIRGEEVAFVAHLGLAEDGYEKDSSLSLDLDLTESGGLQVIVADGSSEILELEDCGDLFTTVGGRLWEATSGRVSLDLRWKDDVGDSCGPGDGTSHIFDARFAFSDLRFRDQEGHEAGVGSFGPFEAEIGLFTCAG